MFTWSEIVALYLLEKLGSTDVVLYLMDVVKEERRDFVEEEAREWHGSLRIKQEERWKRVSELSMKRKFHKMNMSVPITCTLPFDGGMWRNSQIMLKMIRYFRGSFLRSIQGARSPINAQTATASDKIRIVNKLYHNKFMNQGWGEQVAEEALNDHILLGGDDGEDPNDIPDYGELPYICENRSSKYERIEDSLLMIVN